MLRRAFCVCAVLGLASAAQAGAIISLVPQEAAGPNGYDPGQVVHVNVMAQLSAGTPSVPGPAGTTTLIRLRYMQLDVSDSSPALGIGVVDHHADSDVGAIPFWDFSGSTSCAGDPSACGGNYFIDGNISADDLMNITFIGLNSSGSQMITLNQTAAKRVGEFALTMPNAGGEYVLDVLNADDSNPNNGAEIRWGFGSTADPTDPSSPIRAGVTAGGGGIVMIAGQENGLSLPVAIPEPATLALLGMGGLAAAFRRRRAA